MDKIQVKTQEDAEQVFKDKIAPVVQARMQELYNRQGNRIYWKSLWYQAIQETMNEGLIPLVINSK